MQNYNILKKKEISRGRLVQLYDYAGILNFISKQEEEKNELYPM